MRGIVINLPDFWAYSVSNVIVTPLQGIPETDVMWGMKAVWFLAFCM